uniref:Uncharacterized protein n=1 Tax=Arion vulgaris TaxID=1028688 RepID=A0A0B6ZZ37_9EUPU
MFILVLQADSSPTWHIGKFHPLDNRFLIKQFYVKLVFSISAYHFLLDYKLKLVFHFAPPWKKLCGCPCIHLLVQISAVYVSHDQDTLDYLLTALMCSGRELIHSWERAC